jgi:hypothetical protein
MASNALATILPPKTLSAQCGRLAAIFLRIPRWSNDGDIRDFRARGIWQQEEFLIELGKLRAIFGQQIALLGYLFGIDIEEQLADTLPPLPTPGNGDE